MKKIILIFITSLFIGCAPTGVQVTFDDEIQIQSESIYNIM